MKSYILPILFLAIGFTACAQTEVPKELKESIEKEKEMANNENLATATFGAGCFWCVEAVFQELKGVESVVSGYTGGQTKNPTYKEISYGNTGHAEVAQIKYDPNVITFDELLEVFWTTHDPTTLNRQGADVGTQYRSAIFYHDDAQKKAAEKSMKEVATQIWDDPIVTEISPLGPFYVAEDYHQNFYTLNPNYGYCRAVINPKLAKFRKKFADKLKN